MSMGKKVNADRVMTKVLTGDTLSEYLALVVRDNPQAPWPVALTAAPFVMGFPGTLTCVSWTSWRRKY